MLAQTSIYTISTKTWGNILLVHSWDAYCCVLRRISIETNHKEHNLFYRNLTITPIKDINKILFLEMSIFTPSHHATHTKTHILYEPQRILSCSRYCVSHAQANPPPPLDSKAVGTGELWSKTYLLNWQKGLSR